MQASNSHPITYNVAEGTKTFGSVWLTKFHPGYGNEFKKYRPAVVVHTTRMHVDGRFAVIAPLTTSTKNLTPSELLILKKNNQFLEHDSGLLAWYMLTVDTNRLVQKLGELQQTDAAALRQLLRSGF